MVLLEVVVFVIIVWLDLAPRMDQKCTVVFRNLDFGAIVACSFLFGK